MQPHQRNSRPLGSSRTNNSPGNPGNPSGAGGGGGDDNNGIPEYPKVESVDETKKHIENIDAYLAELEQDSDSESEEDQCEATEQPSMDEMSRSLSEEYEDFQEEYSSESSSERFDTKSCSEEKFKQLATDPRSGSISRVSIDEARGAVQAEIEGKLIQPRRPDVEVAKRVDLDMKTEGPGPWTHADLKHPIGSEMLRKQGQSISLEDMSENIGRKIVKQKQKFVGLEGGPESSENVGHIVDLAYVPDFEKEIVKENILKGARNAGSDEGIVFLNDNDNN